MMVTPWTKLRYTFRLQPRWWWAFLEQIRSKELNQKCLCLVAPGLLLQTLPCSLCKRCWRSLSSQARSSQGGQPDLCCAGGNHGHIWETCLLRDFTFVSEFCIGLNRKGKLFKKNAIDFILLTSHLFKAVFSLEKKVPNLVTVIGSINSCGYEETGQNMLKRQMLWISQEFKWVECMCCSYTIFL